MGKKFTKEEFLKKIAENNKNDIDYSNFIYSGNNVKSECRCNVCGHIWHPIPMSLFKGHGCPKCAIEHKARNLSKNSKLFIEEAIAIHGTDYDYSLVDYKNDKTKVDIICNKCGKVFQQKPFLHLNGHGCIECNGGVSHTQERFINDVKEKNKHNLILNEFVYVNSSTKGKCICGDCGHEWMVLPSSLKKGHGCPKCSANKRGAERRKPFNVFIDEYSSLFPNNKLEFVEDTYETALKDMTVICSIHGKFEKTPNELLNGAGCPFCRESKLEREIRCFLESKNITFTKHKDDFKWLGLQHLDFYLPEYDAAIECQGSQHYKETNYYGGKKKLEKQSEADLRKFNLCNVNNVRILYYTDYKGEIPETYKPYTYFDKNELLEEILKNGNNIPVDTK